MDQQAEAQLADLVCGQRWGCLATLADDKPYASFVAYVPERDFGALLLHVSRLAPHTQNLLTNPCVTLAITEQDPGKDDPQTLARVSIQGRVAEIGRNTSSYPEARTWYVRRLPTAEQLFTFSDFILFRLVPSQVRFVAGFARTWDISPEQFKSIAGSKQD